MPAPGQPTTTTLPRSWPHRSEPSNASTPTTPAHPEETESSCYSSQPEERESPPPPFSFSNGGGGASRCFPFFPPPPVPLLTCRGALSRSSRLSGFCPRFRRLERSSSSPLRLPPPSAPGVSRAAQQFRHLQLAEGAGAPATRGGRGRTRHPTPHTTTQPQRNRAATAYGPLLPGSDLSLWTRTAQVKIEAT